MLQGAWRAKACEAIPEAAAPIEAAGCLRGGPPVPVDPEEWGPPPSVELHTGAARLRPSTGSFLRDEVLALNVLLDDIPKAPHSCGTPLFHPARCNDSCPCSGAPANDWHVTLSFKCTLHRCHADLRPPAGPAEPAGEHGEPRAEAVRLRQRQAARARRAQHQLHMQACTATRARHPYWRPQSTENGCGFVVVDYKAIRLRLWRAPFWETWRRASNCIPWV